MADVRAACEENLLSTVNTRCALCALRWNGNPSTAQDGQDRAVSHALLVVSPAADVQLVDRLIAEASRHGMVLVDMRPGAASIPNDALPRDIQFRSSAARNNALSDHRLLAFLRDHAVVHFFMPGSGADASIKQTALSALDKGYRVTLVDDAALPHSAKMERITKDLESRGIFTITSPQFASLAITTRRADSFRTVHPRAPLSAFSERRPANDVFGADRKDADTRLAASDSPARSPVAGPPAVKRRRSHHWIAWMAPAALVVGVIALPGPTHLDLDDAWKAAADRLALVLAPARSVAAAEQAPAPPAYGGAAAQRADRRTAIDLSHDLAALRTEFDAAVRESARASDQARERQLASERALVEMIRDLRREREKTASLTAELATAQEELDRQKEDPAGNATAPRSPAVSSTASALPAAKPAPPSVTAATSPSGSAANEDAPRLMARARQLLSHGDISGARTVLERVSETGDVLALFALAETYDPQALAAMGTLGTVGDAAKARTLYTVALARGVEKASDRLRALQNVPAGATP